MPAKNLKISKIQTTGFYKKILIGFSAFAVSMAGLIVYYSLSKTIITVTLNPQNTSTTFSVAVRADAQEQNSSSIIAVSGTLSSMEVSGTDTFDNPSTGEEVPAQATGLVTVYNNYSADQPLAATTRLLTPDSTLFRIKDRIDVPAGGKVENVEVYADQPGKSGNIDPTRFTIPGLWQGLQDKIYAESTNAMTGGLRSGKIITREFYTASLQSVTKTLAEQAVTEFNNQQPLSSLRATTSMLYPVILSESASAQEGEEAATLTVDVDMRYIIVLIDPATLESLAYADLASGLPVDVQIDPAVDPQLEYSVESYDLENSTARLNVKYTASTIPRLSNVMFNRDEVTGKDAQEIKAYFSHFDEIKDVQIKFSPFWVTKAPQLKDHIEIRLDK
ncbi:MAG: hypothetical protein WC544_01775 [Patescibacteria group bacterium]